MATPRHAQLQCNTRLQHAKGHVCNPRAPFTRSDWKSLKFLPALQTLQAPASGSVTFASPSVAHPVSGAPKLALSDAVIDNSKFG